MSEFLFESDEDALVITEDVDKPVNSVVKISNTDLCDDINTKNIPQDIDEIELQIDRLKRKWNEFTYLIGQRLKFINDTKLYEKKGYKDFGTYVRIALKMSENNAYYYISIFNYFTEEQTKIAGSKLKLIIPVLNKVKKDKNIPEEIRDIKIKDLSNELYIKIRNSTYREAEKIINNLKKKYFFKIDDIKKENKKIVVKKDRIIIYEEDEYVQKLLFNTINQFYNEKL